MSHEQKFAVNMNQITMIKLALYLDDNEMSKMISLGQDYTLVNSKANMYIVEYYKNLLKKTLSSFFFNFAEITYAIMKRA